MPMPQDLAGKIIKFEFKGAYPPDKTKLQNSALVDHAFSPGALQLYDIGGATGGQQFKPSGKTWQFDFLKYVPGYVTVAPLNTAILTGPMSGCYLIRYTEGGQRYIAHIGTVDTADDPGTIAAKKYWKAFVARREVTDISGASPANLYSDTELLPLMPFGAGPPPVLGYFDGAGVGYAMAFVQVASNIKGKMLPGLFKVVSVKPMPLSPWSSIAQSDKFKD